MAWRCGKVFCTVKVVRTAHMRKSTRAPVHCIKGGWGWTEAASKPHLKQHCSSLQPIRRSTVKGKCKVEIDHSSSSMLLHDAKEAEIGEDRCRWMWKCGHILYKIKDMLIMFEVASVDQGFGGYNFLHAGKCTFSIIKHNDFQSATLSSSDLAVVWQ
jgi:hypothetical protein